MKKILLFLVMIFGFTAVTEAQYRKKINSKKTKENMTISLNQLGQISLTVDDIDLAEHFYEEILGLQKLYRFGDLLFFDCAGVRLFISKPENEAFSPKSSVLYFRSGDIAVSVQELAAKRVSFIEEPHLTAEMEDHDLWMAFFTDPAGNTLALMYEAPKGYSLTR